jgi:hypothetical protein
MHPTAALVHVNARIAELLAEAKRERLADEARRPTRPAGPSIGPNSQAVTSWARAIPHRRARSISPSRSGP